MVNYELLAILTTVIVQALYIAYRIGNFEEKLVNLEKKQDKHNNIIERVYHLEDSSKSAHYRIDEIKEEINAKF